MIIRDITGLLGQSRDSATTRMGVDPEVTLVDEGLHLTWPMQGIEATLDDRGRVLVVFAHAAPGPLTAGYSGQLPYDLEFTMARSEVRAKLGTPETSGDAAGAQPAWDRYAMDEYYMTLSYGADNGAISLITLFHP